MSTLQFALKFSMTLFVLCLHFGLVLLFLLSFIVRSGKSTEGIAFGVEIIVFIMVSIRLWYYWARYRKMTYAQRMRRDAIDERVFVVVLWVLSLANAVWISVHALSLPDGFAGLPRPDFAAVAIITLTWLAWTLCEHLTEVLVLTFSTNTRSSSAVHLIWILVQEETSWFDEEDLEKPIQWPSTASTYTPEPPRHRPLMRGGRLSAKIVAVQHGSPPELWAKNRGMAQREVAPPVLQPARPTYDPKARQMREPPPIKTSQYQWYITPGEAF
ncbi:hypothetical protein C8Q80DRAFT_1120527 [Daedaleopsis nitida]|nr:hypothetical protein C8Q80DRAFT_1120527 [Daedaleopsis nitida]